MKLRTDYISPKMDAKLRIEAIQTHKSKNGLLCHYLMRGDENH